MLNTGKLAGKTLYITGASRGIGKAIALKAAKDKANVVIAAKTAEAHPKLPGTIFTAAKERSDAGLWFLDLKNGNGSCGQGEPSSSSDVKFTLNDSDFMDMFQGKLKPTAAFMSGKLKLEGDMSKAMALDKLMGKIHTRGFHSVSRISHLRHQSRSYSDYTNVPEVFDRIREVANADIVKKVNATYCFDVEGEGKYVVDLKNGEGSVTKGEPKETPDCTIQINQTNIIKLFNREIKPATAFMTGQLKLSGDLTKAMALEAVMKASREAREFHTMASHYAPAADAPPALYESVPQVFERIKGVANEDIVKKVQAIYVFDVEEEGKYFIDFKNGTGEVGKGEASTKADVTITMNTANFLKIFNRELSPATAFMTGQIKVSGDLSKALTLEKVMKAAREAAEAAAGKK